MKKQIALLILDWFVVSLVIVNFLLVAWYGVRDN